jgi:hypothetical protein
MHGIEWIHGQCVVLIAISSMFEQRTIHLALEASAQHYTGINPMQEISDLSPNTTPIVQAPL